MFTWRRPARAETSPDTPSGASVDVQRLLHRLEWTVLRRLDGQLQGDYRNLLRGSGVELADLREYQPHDDVRRIDWATTARMQTPYVREYQEDRDMTAWLVLDLSASLSVGQAARSKRMLALELSGVLAQIIQRRGNPVGALLHDAGAQAIGLRLPPRVGRRHVLQLMHAIAHMPVSSQGQGTHLGRVFTQAAGVLRRRSTVIVVSDFLSAPGWEDPLGWLARRHDVVAVRLRDPIELAWPAAGMLWLQDVETGERLWVDTHDAAFRRRFAEQAQAREVQFRQSMAHAGVDTLELRTDEPLDQAVLDFIRMRQPRRWLSQGARSR